MDFRFPPLGPTGVGDPVYPPGKTKEDFHFSERPTYWAPDEKETDLHGYWVTYQLDRPACAFRCHYPGGSSPCNRETADMFIAWVKKEIG